MEAKALFGKQFIIKKGKELATLMLLKVPKYFEKCKSEDLCPEGTLCSNCSLNEITQIKQFLWKEESQRKELRLFGFSVVLSTETPKDFIKTLISGDYYSRIHLEE